MDNQVRELDKNEKEQIETLLLKLSQNEIEKKIVENENESLRKLAINTFRTFELNKYILDIEDRNNQENNKKVNFTLVQPSQIVYDLPTIRGKFEKDELKKFVDTTYFLNDVEGFKEMLKKYKVPNKEVKKFIEKEDKLREDKLKKLYEIGEITVDQLSGCYTVKENTEYIKITFSNK